MHILSNFRSLSRESNPKTKRCAQRSGRAWNYLFLLAYEYAASVCWIAAVEGEQQIQGWEAEDIN